MKRIKLIKLFKNNKKKIINNLNKHMIKKFKCSNLWYTQNKKNNNYLNKKNNQRNQKMIDIYSKILNQIYER